MIETPEWQRKIDAANATLGAESTEAASMMRRNEGPELDFCRRALAVTRILLHETRTTVPDHGWAVIVVSLFVHMVSVLRAALTLAEAGHGRELPLAIRPALEALITMRFIAERDQMRRAKHWLDYTAIAKRSLVRKHSDLFDSPEHGALRERINQRAEELADSFPGRFWASGLGCSGLRVMADQVGLLWYYDAVYWAGSQPTHATAIAVEESISVSEEETPIYHVGLSGRGVHKNLAAYCDFLIRGLAQLNDLFTLGIDEVLQDLTAEFVSRFDNVLDKEKNR